MLIVSFLLFTFYSKLALKPHHYTLLRSSLVVLFFIDFRENIWQIWATPQQYKKPPEWEGRVGAKIRQKATFLLLAVGNFAILKK